MDKVDLVLVGSEAVVESGGLINAVGSYQTAIIARAANKPFYALAESFKFLRLFPLDQYDLPFVGGEEILRRESISSPGGKNNNRDHGRGILALPSQRPTAPGLLSRTPTTTVPRAPPTPMRSSSSMAGGFFNGTTSVNSAVMSPEQLAMNPEVDYTTPDLITLVFSDVGILTPEGVSQFLVGIFSD